MSYTKNIRKVRSGGALSDVYREPVNFGDAVEAARQAYDAIQEMRDRLKTMPSGKHYGQLVLAIEYLKNDLRAYRMWAHDFNVELKEQGAARAQELLRISSEAKIKRIEMANQQSNDRNRALIAILRKKIGEEAFQECLDELNSQQQNAP